MVGLAGQEPSIPGPLDLSDRRRVPGLTSPDGLDCVGLVAVGNRQLAGLPDAEELPVEGGVAAVLQHGRRDGLSPAGRDQG